jgi:hypothetical protein
MPPERTLSLVFDPSGLSPRQRRGRACVVCQKAWPLPEVKVGRLPDENEVYACWDCSDYLTGTDTATQPIMVPVPRSRHPLHLDLHHLTHPVRSLIERAQARHILP